MVGGGTICWGREQSRANQSEAALQYGQSGSSYNPTIIGTCVTANQLFCGTLEAVVKHWKTIPQDSEYHPAGLARFVYGAFYLLRK